MHMIFTAVRREQQNNAAAVRACKERRLSLDPGSRRRAVRQNNLALQSRVGPGTQGEVVYHRRTRSTRRARRRPADAIPDAACSNGLAGACGPPSSERSVVAHSTTSHRHNGSRSPKTPPSASSRLSHSEGRRVGRSEPSARWAPRRLRRGGSGRRSFKGRETPCRTQRARRDRGLRLGRKLDVGLGHEVGEQGSRSRRPAAPRESFHSARHSDESPSPARDRSQCDCTLPRGPTICENRTTSWPAPQPRPTTVSPCEGRQAGPLGRRRGQSSPQAATKRSATISTCLRQAFIHMIWHLTQPYW